MLNLIIFCLCIYSANALQKRRGYDATYYKLCYIQNSLISAWRPTHRCNEYKCSQKRIRSALSHASECHVSSSLTTQYRISGDSSRVELSVEAVDRVESVLAVGDEPLSDSLESAHVNPSTGRSSVPSRRKRLSVSLSSDSCGKQLDRNRQFFRGVWALCASVFLGFFVFILDAGDPVLKDITSVAPNVTLFHFASSASLAALCSSRTFGRGASNSTGFTCFSAPSVAGKAIMSPFATRKWLGN